MTSAELLAKIKAEIDKLYGKYKDKFLQCGDQYHLGLFDGLDMAKRVLSTLESEKPMQEGLEEEIDRLWESFADEMEGPHNLFDIYARLARHFAQWGTEHAKNSDEKSIPNGLDESTIAKIVMGVITLDDDESIETMRNFSYADLVIAGAKWQKEQDDKELSEKITAAYQLGIAHQNEQMMKEAVDADVMLTLHDKTGDISLHTGYLPKELGIKCDDKVRIIIVKED